MAELGFFRVAAIYIHVIEHYLKAILSQSEGKVQILFEGQRIWKNRPSYFDISQQCENKLGVFFKFLWPSQNV